MLKIPIRKLLLAEFVLFFYNIPCLGKTSNQAASLHR